MSRLNRTDRLLAKQGWMSKILLVKSQKETRDMKMETGERESLLCNIGKLS